MDGRRQCRNAIDRWSELAFEDPAAGARHAERCLDRVADLGYPPDLHARALSIHGTSLRYLGDLDAAEEAYSQALRIYSSLAPDPDRGDLTHDEADLHRRWAYLRAFQDRFPEALASAHRAAQLFAALGDRHAFGRALLARGSVLLMMDDTRTIPVLARSLSYLDSTQSRHCLPALYNLTYAFSLFHDLSPEDLERTLDLVTEARLSLRSRQRRPAARNLAGHRRVTPPDALFRYLQGRLLVLLKAHDRARPLLETAREDLLALGMLRDVATVSVELAECHFWLAGRYRWHRVSVLCAEVLGELSAAAVPSDILAAYRLLQASARARSAELLREGLREARSLLTRPT